MKLGEVTRNDTPRVATLKLENRRDELPQVIITASALRALYENAQRGRPNEIGGFLLGLPLIDAESRAPCTYIEGIVPAICESTPTHVKMLPESFVQFEAARTATGKLKVGYYHSHPGLSVFQSGEDIDNFTSFYPEEYQIAIVVDPTRTTPESAMHDGHGDWIGFFAWDASHKARRLAPTHIQIASAPLADIESAPQASTVALTEGTRQTVDAPAVADSSELAASPPATPDAQPLFEFSFTLRLNGKGWRMRWPGFMNAKAADREPGR